MGRGSTTADLIVEAARRRFNERGYAATTLTEIASIVGISQGNLTYHFPTKRDLVTRMQEHVAEAVGRHRASPAPGDLEDDYVRHVLFTMEITAAYRYLLRDDAQIEPGPDHQTPHAVLVNGRAALRALLERVHDSGMFRNDIPADIETLTTCLWILDRYWVDHLSEMELRSEIDRHDQRRGVEHHLALLLPNLNAPARRRFEAALARSAVAREPVPAE